MKFHSRSAAHLVAALGALALVGCGGGGGGGGGAAPPATFTVGGTATGRTAGDSTLVLQNNGGDNLSITANGLFTFATSVTSGGAYAVTVLAPPGGKTCTVGNGSGTAMANVTNVTVTCAPVSGGAIALPKTGQTTCFNAAGGAIGCAGTGQDGELQAGIAAPNPRFVVDGTGNCVTDNLTGLMWTRNANLPAGTRTWQQVLDFAKLLDLCGFTDWRLPNRRELRSLVNYGVSDNAALLNTQGFTGVQAGFYWTSSSLAAGASKAWVVIMRGDVSSQAKNVTGFVWPVRAGQ